MSNPCKNGGTCSGCSDNYYCTCPKGFRGQQCQSSRLNYFIDFKHYNSIGEKLKYLKYSLNNNTLKTNVSLSITGEEHLTSLQF